MLFSPVYFDARRTHRGASVDISLAGAMPAISIKR